MPFDQIDEALRRQPTWDPPAEFGRRVAAVATRQPHLGVAPTTALTSAWHGLAGVMSSCSAIVGGYMWMLRQYWALLAR
jgi:hypothetical protein